MNCLGISCSVEKKLGRLTIVIINDEDEAYYFVFKSPSIFSFTNNSAEILNWHRDNILSLITQFNIDGLVVKKSERTSFISKIKNSDIFKLYMEGVMLSLAGSIGKFNKHFYKIDIQSKLNDKNIFENSIDAIFNKYGITNNFGALSAGEMNSAKETLLAVVALKKSLTK
jgi:hypothetical protein